MSTDPAASDAISTGFLSNSLMDIWRAEQAAGNRISSFDDTGPEIGRTITYTLAEPFHEPYYLTMRLNRTFVYASARFRDAPGYDTYSDGMVRLTAPRLAVEREKELVDAAHASGRALPFLQRAKREIDPDVADMTVSEFMAAQKAKRERTDLIPGGWLLWAILIPSTYALIYAPAWPVKLGAGLFVVMCVYVIVVTLWDRVRKRGD